MAVSKAMAASAARIAPDPVQVNQIYTLVNSVFKQMTGRIDITATDTNSLVAMGQEVGNLGKFDLYLNTLARRIGYTIDGYRIYRNRESDMARDAFTWGALVQKLTAEMPEAVEDKIYDVGKMDGQSIDHYIISNPKVHQRIFDKETPYSFFITTQTYLLEEAFLSASAMQGLISQIFGKVQNKIEFTHEELARLTKVNFVANLPENQEVHLVTMYNNARPAGTTALDTQSALFDADFIRFAIGMMENIGIKMEGMTSLFNADGFDRFTPATNRKFHVLSDFKTQVTKIVQYDAFNEKYVNVPATNYVPYWQAQTLPTQVFSLDGVSEINATNAAGEVVTKKNLIGLMFDYDAMGMFRQYQNVLTTPVNARAAYYNTFWHEKQLWFNDMSENGVAFYLD